MMGASPEKIPHGGAFVSALGSRPAILAAIGYLGAAAVLFWPLPIRLATHMAGDPFGDPLLNAWILGWGADRLAHGLAGWWDAPIFFPAPGTLAWSEHLLGVVFFVAPVYWLTGSIVLTYNVALLGSVVLAGLGGYLLARELTGDPVAAWVGGLLFACLPYRIAQITHLQVLMAGWMPLALLALHRYFGTGSRGALAGFAVAYLLTALSNGYYLFFLAPPVALVSAWHLHDRWRRRQPVGRPLAGLAVASLAVAAALTPVAAAYVRVQQAQGFVRSRAEMAMYSATVADYARVSPHSRRWGGALAIGEPERQLFPGVALVALAAIGLAAGWRRPWVRLYAGVAVVALLLSLGPEPDLGVTRLRSGPFDWLRLVPGVSGLRVPARFAMIVGLALAMLAAAGLHHLTGPRRRRLAAGLAVAISAIALVEGRPAVPVVATTRALSLSDEAYRWLAAQPAGAVLELPAGEPRETVRYLAGTLVHRHPLVNGYSGWGSALQDLFAGPPSLEPSLAEALLEAAAAAGVRYVLVHEHLYADRAFGARLASALRQASPALVRASRTIDFTTAIELSDPPPAPAPPADPPLPIDGCALSASHRPDTVGRAVDGDRESRWLSGPAQSGDEWIAVHCAHTQILTSVELLFAHRSLANYPRRLVIERSTDGVTFEAIQEGSPLALLARSLADDGRAPAARIAVQPVEFKAIRLRQVGRAERPSFWAVDELILRGR